MPGVADHSATGLDIVYADRHVVVVNKPAGMLSIPGRGPDKADCVAARVRDAFPHARGPLIAHRLDMDTSGLIILGLDPHAQRFLSLQFERRRVEKRYVALVDGSPTRDTGTIDLPLRADWPNRPRQIVCFESGKPAQTRWRVLARETDRTRLELEPVTGRTHQLRVHLADPQGLGALILGDPLYAEGPARDDHPRLMLHAARLSIRLPGTRRLAEFRTRVPF
ncbi:MAG: RluA family pseudouridine synthase [Planctomycetota bacterium]